MRRGWALWLAVLVTVSGRSVAAEGDFPLKHYVEGTLANMRQQCGSVGERNLRLEDLVDQETTQRESVRFMLCECFPQELAKLAASEAAAEKVTDQQARERMNTASEVCTVRAMRKYALPVCLYVDRPTDGAGNLPAYCACFASGTNEFTDRQIIDDLLGKEAYAEARAKAKANGTPKPARFDSIFDPLSQSCRAKAGLLP